MVRLIIVMLLFTQWMSGFSQTRKDTLKNEVLFSSSLGRNGMYYSRKISGKLWLRTGIGLMYGYNYTWPTNSMYYPNSKEEWGVYLLLGIITNKAINKYVEFSYGSELYYGYRQSLYKNYNPAVVRPDKYVTQLYGIGLVAAFYYKISDYFMLGTRFRPALSYYSSTTYYRISMDPDWDYLVVKFRF